MSTPDSIVTALDAVRFIVALVGVLYGTMEVHDVIIDRRVLLASKQNGARLILANANIYNEGLRLFIQFVFLFFAATSLALPYPADMYRPLMLVNRFLLIVVTVCLTIKSYVDRRARAALIQYWLEDQKQKRRITD